MNSHVSIDSLGGGCRQYGCTYAKVLEEVLGLGVDVELTVVGVLGEVQSRDLGNVLVLALSLLLLELEGDTTDGTALDTLHQVGGVAGCRENSMLIIVPSVPRSAAAIQVGVLTNLVAEALGSNDGDLIADTLVGLEVQGELGVVSLNDDLGGLLDSLGTNATHFGGIAGCRRAMGVGVGRWVLSVRTSRNRVTFLRCSFSLILRLCLWTVSPTILSRADGI